MKGSSDNGGSRDLTALWRNRAYWLLLSGQTLSLVGTAISGPVFLLLVLSLTESPAQAGLVGGLQRLPYLILALPAGVLVDRWDRKRTMVVCEAGRCLALGSITLTVLVGRRCLLGIALSASLHRPLRRVPKSAFVLDLLDAQVR